MSQAVQDMGTHKPRFHGNVIARRLRAPRDFMPRRAFPVERRLSIAEIAKSLDVTTLAVNNWRKGSSQREPLHFEVAKLGNANRVWIRERALLNWLGVHRPDLLGKWNKCRR